MLAGLPEAAKESLGEQVLFPKRLGTTGEYADLAHLPITHSQNDGETIRMDGGSGWRRSRAISGGCTPIRNDLHEVGRLHTCAFVL